MMEAFGRILFTSLTNKIPSVIFKCSQVSSFTEGGREAVGSFSLKRNEISFLTVRMFSGYVLEVLKPGVQNCSFICAFCRLLSSYLHVSLMALLHEAMLWGMGNFSKSCRCLRCHLGKLILAGGSSHSCLSW